MVATEMGVLATECLLHVVPQFFHLQNGEAVQGLTQKLDQEAGDLCLSPSSVTVSL